MTFYFESAKSDVSLDKEKEFLSAIAQGQQKMAEIDSTKQNKKWSVLIEGHTDNIGNSIYNLDLSERRAYRIKEIFLKSGSPINNLTVNFYGKQRPANSNETEEDRQKNRRVEFSIQCEVTNKPDVIQEAPKTSISELFAKLKKQPEIYCIDPARDTTLFAPGGTAIYLKAGAFDAGNYCPGKCITLKLTEYFKKSEIVLNNLSTTSDGRLLESGGMLYINAECDGIILSLRNKEDMFILLPTDSILPGMKLFTGQRTGHDSILNWNPYKDVGKGWKFGISGVDTDCYCNKIDSSLLKKYNSIEKKCKYLPCKIKRFFASIFRKKSTRAKKKKPDNMNTKESECLKYCLFIEKIREAERIALEEKRKDTEKKIQSGEKEIDIADLQYYVFNPPSNQLGWINCDRFAQLPTFAKTTLKINIKKDVDVDCKIVFKKMRSIMPAYSKDGEDFSFENIPLGEIFTVVVLKNDNHIPYMGIKEIVVGRTSIDVPLKKCTLEDIGKLMKSID